MLLRLLLSLTDSCCMLVNAFLMLESYVTKASVALCPRHSKTICYVFQCTVFFPSLWSLGGWCGYFPGLTSSTSSSSPALGLQANKNGQHLSTCSSNPRNMYVQQNAWRWTRSFNRVKAIFGFFRQTSAPWRVPIRSTHQKHTQTTTANRNRCLQVVQYLKAWNQASEVHQENAKKY